MTTVEQARGILLDNIKENSTETVQIMELKDRVLAQDIISPIDNPPFSKSPLDGYAVRAVDIEGCCTEKSKRLRVIDKVYAGNVSKKVVECGECIRIMTGAKMPEGADCVVKQEDCKVYGEDVDVYTSHKPYQNYIFKGEDFKIGERILKKGTLIKSSHIMAIASLGIDKALVYKKPVVGVIATGSEIQHPGEALDEGKIYNSNGYFISARLKELGAEPIMFDFAEDDENNIIEVLRKSQEKCDVVITTGGVSVGEKDILKECAQKSGYNVLFHRVDLKPGSPILAAKNESTLLIGLSGTPVAAATTFELFARPVISKLLSCEEINYKVIKGIVQDGGLKVSKKRRFVRVNIEQDYTNRIYINHKMQSPGQIHTMLNSNGLMEVPKDSSVNENDEVNVILL